MQSIICVAPRCPRGSFVPYKIDEHQFHPVLASQDLELQCTVSVNVLINFLNKVYLAFERLWFLTAKHNLERFIALEVKNV